MRRFLRKQSPPPRRQVPVTGSAEPDLGLHALSVPIAPLGHRDGRRTIDEQARLGVDPLQVGAVGRREQRHQVGAPTAAYRIKVRNLADPAKKHGRLSGSDVAGCEYAQRFSPAVLYIAK